MGLETKSIIAIEKQFAELGASSPNMYWEHGTLWIDTNDKANLNVIKDAMLEDVLADGYEVDFNLLKATKNEPWDQWAMDIVEKG